MLCKGCVFGQIVLGKIQYSKGKWYRFACGVGLSVSFVQNMQFFNGVFG